MTRHLAIATALALAIGTLPALAVTPKSEARMQSQTNGFDDPGTQNIERELSYLHDVCPGVLAHPAQHSETLVRFCSERG